jgi:GTP-binding protein
MHPAMVSADDQNGAGCLSTTWRHERGAPSCQISLLSKILTMQDHGSLRRVFLLINAKHGFSTYDGIMLEDLDRRFKAAAGLSFNYQIVLTKIDALHVGQIADVKNQVEQEARKITQAWSPNVLITSTKGQGFGIDKLREAIVEACN